MAACLLWRLPEEGRRPQLADILYFADAADRYRKRLGKTHAVWGDGSVAGYIGIHFSLPPEPSLAADGFLEAKLAVLSGLLEWRREQKRML